MCWYVPIYDEGLLQSCCGDFFHHQWAVPLSHNALSKTTLHFNWQNCSVGQSACEWLRIGLNVHPDIYCIECRPTHGEAERKKLKVSNQSFAWSALRYPLDHVSREISLNEESITEIIHSSFSHTKRLSLFDRPTTPQMGYRVKHGNTPCYCRPTKLPYIFSSNEKTFLH